MTITFSTFQMLVYAPPLRHCLMLAMILVCSLFSCVEASAALVTVSKQVVPYIFADTDSSVFEDPTQRLGIETVSASIFAAEFQPLRHIGTSIFTESAVWWRMTISNKSGEQCYLHVHNIGTDTIDIYIPSEGGQFTHYRYGHLVRNTNTASQHDWQMAMPLPQVGVVPTTIYVRKVAHYAIFFYGSIGTYQAMVEADKERAMFNAAFLGIGCALFLYNFFVFLSLRSKSYLYYLCYTVVFLVHHIFMMGKLHWLFGTEGAMIIHRYGLTSLSCFASMTILWFTGYFLHVRRYSTKIYWALLGMFYFQFCMIFLECVGIFYPHATFLSRQMISVNVGVMSVLCVTSAVVVYYRGNKGARFFLLGWTLWLLTLLYLIFMTVGVIPTTTFGVYHLLQIGAASEMVLMAIALADRINTLRKEKELALSENAQLVQAQNLDLERRVLARTSELEIAYDALVSANQAIQQQVKFQHIQNTRIHEKNLQLEQQNKQLHLLNEEKSNLLGIVAHDLKNPLASIIFAAESTRHFLRAIPPKEVDVEERFLRIESAAERMHGIITNLLSVHTLETGQIKIVPEKFDIVSLVQGMVEDYTEPAAAKYIQLHFRVDDCIHIHSDRSIIAEILDNLISNAIKYSPSGRNVYVSLLTEKGASSMAASAYSLLNGQRSFGERYFLIAVSDEGPGMTEEDKSKLFTKFAKLSARPTAGESSTGLGLAIVKKFVELLRGSIWCESEYGVGTTFYVTLPMDVIQHNQQYN